jgi:hypothetical protein
MPLDPQERDRLIAAFTSELDRLPPLLEGLPPDAYRWQPGPGEWSIDEVLCHLADAEAVDYTRIRFIAVEPKPALRAWYQERWVAAQDYRRLPQGGALAVLRTSRALTAALLRRLPGDVWERAAEHNERGVYTGEFWLRHAVEHLQDHLAQISRNAARWYAAGAPPVPALPAAGGGSAARAERIERYAEGGARLRRAWEAVPAEARQWRPAPGEWSPHEVICHTADSETNAYARIRYLLAEPEPVLVGYDQELWARAFDYHALPAEAALAATEAVRAHTAAVIRRMDDAAWSRAGHHTEMGAYTAETWLGLYTTHLHDHADQIDRAVAAWRAARR